MLMLTTQFMFHKLRPTLARQILKLNYSQSGGGAATGIAHSILLLLLLLVLVFSILEIK